MADTIPLLEYESSMFVELLDEDGLFITAKGISVDHILINFLKIYCDPASLVLVINTTPQEEVHFIDELVMLNALAPKIVTNEFNANEREEVYLNGGVLFVTSRILVVDMLTKKLPIHLITGIIVCRAHKIIDSCQEAFILRLYRGNNKTGFIKAFSDSPQAFTVGFSHVERVMKNLFVKKLYLWPRFHATISAFLERHEPEVMELDLELTPSMRVIQTSILDLMENCLRDIRHSNPSLDAEQLTVEYSINKYFDKLIRLQLDPVWHQLSFKTKQLVADLKVLRMLLHYLTQYDCVTFYNFLQSLRESERDLLHHCLWMFMDAAEPLFKNAKDRVSISSKRNVKRQKFSTDKSTDSKSSSEVEFSKELVLEESPKWKHLNDVLEEIDKENSEPNGDRGHVLIAASDERTCSQLREYLCEGGKALLTRLYEKTKKTNDSEEKALTSIPKQGNSFANSNNKNEEKSSMSKRRTKSKAGQKSARMKKNKTKSTKTMDEFVELVDEKEDDSYENDSEKVTSGTGKLLLKTDTPNEFNITFGLVSTPLIVIHPLNGTSDPYSLTRTLREIEPRYVILYDAQMDFVRELEVFKASRPGVPLRVYFMIYAGSVEEQRYLTTLRKEKEAFESLIKSKGAMVIPEERDGKTEGAVQLDRDSSKPSDVASSRKAGGRQPKEIEDRKVIVDVREFRSELPSLIHKRGINIEPVTLESFVTVLASITQDVLIRSLGTCVGDYILTNDMCVERKSVADLISSLNSGRLYTQCIAMTRFYKRPVLLIEFDPNKSFSLQAKSSLSSQISLQNVTARLTLLTIHFPKLKIFWCPSPYATAELFDDLKENCPEPDAATAMTIGTDESSKVTEVRYNAAPQDFIMKLPGINSKNYKLVMNKVKNIYELSQISKQRLEDILGNSNNAKLLWDFFHSDHKTKT